MRLAFKVPSVSVNFSARELSDPNSPTADLAAGPPWPSARPADGRSAGIGRGQGRRRHHRPQHPPDRKEMGCGVDMDDFGTGNASITSIRRFALRRLKIDRSFVRALDANRDQQQLVTAILSLAERLGLETLAEGVETQGEHAMLAQLGCGHVQGYVVARPMPAEEVTPWLTDHRNRLAEALKIGVRAR
jgi:diguanylate cyclase